MGETLCGLLIFAMISVTAKSCTTSWISLSGGRYGFTGNTARAKRILGANIGSHTIHLAQLAGDQGQVWAFEPQRLVFQLLAGNVALNSLTNVHCLQKCLIGSGKRTIPVPVLDVNRINNWGGVELEHSAEGEPGPSPLIPLTFRAATS